MSNHIYFPALERVSHLKKENYLIVDDKITGLGRKITLMEFYNLYNTLFGVIGEAPLDGNIYGRQNGEWVIINQNQNNMCCCEPRAELISIYIQSISLQPELQNMLHCILNQLLATCSDAVYTAGIGLMESISRQPDLAQMFIDDFNELMSTEINLDICIL